MTNRQVRITKDGEPVLRATAQDVPVAQIISPHTKRVIQDMRLALSGEKYGVAIAAPQIGEPLRIFVVDAKIAGGDVAQVFINPLIIKRSRKRQESHESCLSIQGRPTGPDVAGIVLRPEKMTIAYYNEQGEPQTRGASGLLAAIFDHEIDHLNGTLFIDKAKDLWEIDADFNKIS